MISFLDLSRWYGSESVICNDISLTWNEWNEEYLIVCRINQSYLLATKLLVRYGKRYMHQDKL